jgi:PelA/Pel-15E family pectate lyase
MGGFTRAGPDILSRIMGTRTSTLLAAAALALATFSTAHAGQIGTYRDEPDAWFTGDEGKQILANILTAQRANGGWYKNYDVAKLPEKMAASKDGVGIFDNQATTTEMRVLARAYRVTGDAKFREAFDRGLEYTLQAQYDNGGWPQEYPLAKKGYTMQVTFNDGAMTRVLELLKDVADGKADFAFADSATRAKAQAAFDRGIDCVLKTQLTVLGKKTVWCAQYDEKTLQPAKARAYELPSLSGGESAGIVLLLMSIERPDDRVKQAVQDAVAWFDSAKMTGVRIERLKSSPEEPGKPDVVLVEDPAATEPLWARFYDLDTGKPYYCGRDGVKKATMAEIERERRAGYAWIRPFGKGVMEAYPAWAAKQGVPNVLAKS